jgi:histidine triad (HIT) family protein
MTDACIFCSIVAGEAAASIVHESDRVIAFMDINPVTPGHLLVVPKAHAADLADVDQADVAEMMVVAQSLDTAIRRSDLRSDGVNLFYADGEAAGQEVFHAHLHVFPRFAGDGFGLTIRRDAPPSRSDLDRLAAMVNRAR